MPIRIDRRRARAMAAHFEEAMDLVASEFDALDRRAGRAGRGAATGGHRVAGRRQHRSRRGSLVCAAPIPHPDRQYRLTVVRQPTRLYGHNLADILALSAITVLGSIDGTDEFAVVRGLVEEQPGLVDPRIEDDGPRAGMLSVAQPQWVVRLERAAA